MGNNNCNTYTLMFVCMKSVKENVTLPNEFIFLSKWIKIYCLELSNK